MQHASGMLPPRGSDGSAAGGGYSDLSEWQWPRCSALPVADAAEHKRVPGSIADAAAIAARKISGHPKRAADDAAAPSARKMPGTATGETEANLD